MSNQKDFWHLPNMFGMPYPYAVSIRQPWVHCIFECGKRVENRTWRFGLHMLGETVAIHASKKMDVMDGRMAAMMLGGFDASVLDTLPLGAIVGTAKLSGYVTTDTVWPREYSGVAASDWFVGPVGWILEDVKPLAHPVPCKGKLGFWRIPHDVLDEMHYVGYSGEGPWVR